MKTTIFNTILTGLISGMLFTACSKNDTAAELNNNPEVIATESDNAILNRELRISFAKDGPTDITDQFKDFTFKFLGSYPSGTAQVWNDLLAKTGSWSMPQGSTSFTISYPTDVFTQLTFLNRQWTIGESTAGSITLIGNDGDQVRLVTKNS